MGKYTSLDIKKAKEALYNHGVIAFPTETVMGLAVIYDDKQAYNKLNQVKQRPEDKPYTMMVKDKEQIAKYAVINEQIQSIIDRFMPGSITILLRVKENSVPKYVTHDTDVIGIRIPENEEALTLLKAVDKPLLVPSANRSGCKPTINSEETREVFADELDYIIPGEAKLSKASTIVDLTGQTPKVVRVGPILEEEILNAWNCKEKC